MSNDHPQPTLDAIILCGGFGTRLGELTRETPKPLLPVAGRPFLWHLLRHLSDQGIRRIVLATHHLSDQFRVFANTCGEEFGELVVSSESTPLGTGGAVRLAAEHVQSPSCLILNGDSVVAQPIAPVVAAHRASSAAFTMVAVRAERTVGGARRKGCVQIGDDGSLLGLATPDAIDTGWINGGIYVADRALLLGWPSRRFDLEACLDELLRGHAAQVFHSSAALLDIGTPECYALAQDWMTGCDAASRPGHTTVAR